MQPPLLRCWVHECGSSPEHLVRDAQGPHFHGIGACFPKQATTPLATGDFLCANHMKMLEQHQRTNDPVLHERNRVRQKHALKLQTRFVKWHEPRAMSCTEDQRSRLAVVDQAATTELLQNLDKVTQCGVMPSFGVEGARSGYIEKRNVRRAEKIGTTLLCAEAGEALLSLLRHCKATGCAARGQGGPCHEDLRSASADTGTDLQMRITAASIGGAGGSDALGLVLLLEYLELRHIPIECTVYEYELGWEAACSALGETALMDGHSVLFSPCDLTCSITDNINCALLERVRAVSMDLIIISYCLIENALKLRESEFAFIHGLLEETRNSCTVVLILDSSWKLWGEISDIAVLYGYKSAYPWSKFSKNALLLVPTNLCEGNKEDAPTPFMSPGLENLLTKIVKRCQCGNLLPAV